MTLRTLFLGCLTVLTGFAAPSSARDVGKECPSAEACLSSSLERSAQQYYNMIKQAWAEKKKIEALIDRAKALGKPELIEELKTEKERIDANWDFAESVAYALTSPKYEDYINFQYEETENTAAMLRARLEKETTLYRQLQTSTIGPERDSVIRDIESYEKEAQDIGHEILYDGIGLIIASIGHTASVVPGTLPETFPLKHKLLIDGATSAVSALASSGSLAHDAFRMGIGIQNAQNNHKQELIESIKGVTASSLNVIALFKEFQAKAAMEAAEKVAKEATKKAAGMSSALITTQLLLMELDTILLLDAYERLGRAEARQIVVETNDVHWRKRLEVSGRMLSDAKKREQRALRQIQDQRRIKNLFTEIQGEARP